ncbi:unnamed protein product [Enterobius vermicularis]|uniref:Mothers against decapentaplegic homolog n=1 Tax=Enterobius vermicularis TaxID=51028 RepID=A0A3P6IFI5_ENTVE|nr:unnamed protein product [Enterobius vermicularis]
MATENGLAIDSLVKKLKKRKNGQGTVEDLEYALGNPGAHSKCVTIPRSLDGRLQVSHRKGLPHVIYCRVWRWPNLQSHHELKSIPECMFPYENSSKQQPICINPYHYQRIESQVRRTSRYPSISPGSSAMSISPVVTSPSVSILSDDEQMMDDGRYSYAEPPAWGSITYYELNDIIGGPFKFKKDRIVIDGYFAPSTEDRICIGSLLSLHKNETVQNTRKHIGKGSRDDNSRDVCLRNVSAAPIFVQSQNANYILKSPATTVMRLPPGHSMKIFDFQSFLKVTNGDPFCSAYKLTAMCFIRLSFVKGWGANYPRKEVTSTPCWIELILNDPLAVMTLSNFYVTHMKLQIYFCNLYLILAK